MEAHGSVLDPLDIRRSHRPYKEPTVKSSTSSVKVAIYLL